MQLHVISPIKCANLSLMLAHHPFLTSSASKCRIALGNISSCVGICGFGSARNVCQCRLPLPSSLLPLNPPCDVPRRVRLHCDYLSNLALTLFAPSLCLSELRRSLLAHSPARPREGRIRCRPNQRTVRRRSNRRIRPRPPRRRSRAPCSTRGWPQWMALPSRQSE